MRLHQNDNTTVGQGASAIGKFASAVVVGIAVVLFASLSIAVPADAQGSYRVEQSQSPGSLVRVLVADGDAKSILVCDNDLNDRWRAVVRTSDESGGELTFVVRNGQTCGWFEAPDGMVDFRACIVHIDEWWRLGCSGRKAI